MAYSLRSHRASIAAGVLTFALVAPAVTVIDSPSLAVAHVQEAGVFNDRYETENFWGKPEAKITGLSLDPGTTVAATTNTIFNWRFRNDGGTLVLIRPQTAVAFKTGNLDIPVKITPAGEKAYTTTLRVNVVDVDEAKEAAQQTLQEQVDGWQDDRYQVDFKDSKVQDVDGPVVPKSAKVAKKGIGQAGWSVTNNNGKLSVTAPGNFTGTANQDIPITITDQGATVETTLKIQALGPEKPASNPGAGLGGFLGNVVGGLLGGGGNGGLFSDLVHVEVHPSAVVVSDNGKVNLEPGAISDNGKVNLEPSAVVVSDNLRDNGILEPGAVGVDVNARVEEGALQVTDNRVIQPGGVTDNGVVEAGAVAPNLGSSSGRTGGAALTGGLDDPRCIASLVGISLPVAALVPLALAQGLSLPSLEAISAIAAGAFDDAARQFEIDPAVLTAVGGGLVGAALAALVGVAVATCPPRATVESVDTPADANSTAGTSNDLATVVAESTEPVTV